MQQPSRHGEGGMIDNPLPVQIAHDWNTEDLKTIEDCDKALAYLDAVIQNLTRRLKTIDLHTPKNQRIGKLRAEKRTARAAVERIRKQFADKVKEQKKRARIEASKIEDRYMLAVIREDVGSDQMREWHQRAIKRLQGGAA